MQMQCGELASRALVRVSGTGSSKFLQGLMTADINKITSTESTLYGAFLNHRGRVEYDAFITRDGESDKSFLIDVAQSQVAGLIGHLSRYRLRSQALIEDVTSSMRVWVLWGCTEGLEINDMWVDPRMKELGYRGILPVGKAPSVSTDNYPTSDKIVDKGYTCWRTFKGVPEGNDFEGCPLPLDMGLDLLSGVAFDKGCYLGQELTARTHYTGVVRKRVTPFVYLDGESSNDSRDFEEMLQSGDESFATFNKVLDITAVPCAQRGEKMHAENQARALGTVTSSVHNLGLAMIRLDETFPAKEMERPGVHKRVGVPLSLPDGKTVFPWRPAWWAK